VVLVGSTGSAAFARGRAGTLKRAGGSGPLLGDEGSGFWLGREAARDARLRRRLRLPHPLDLAHAADPVRATAALAPRALRAPRLRAAAAAHLAAIAAEAARAASLPRPRPLALHGGLFHDARLRAAVLRALGPGWRVVAPRVDAARAAAGLGRLSRSTAATATAKPQRRKDAENGLHRLLFLRPLCLGG
jgi:hypothetical protein